MLVLKDVAVVVAVAVEMAVALAMAVAVVVAVVAAMKLTSLTRLIFENDVANALSSLVKKVLNLLSLSIVKVATV